MNKTNCQYGTMTAYKFYALFMYSFGYSYNQFSFHYGQGSKRRPVMVIKDTDDKDILIAKTTSQLYNTKFDISYSTGSKQV